MSTANHDVDAELHRMVSAIDAAVMIVDDSGTIEVANEQMSRLVARPLAAIEKHAVGEIFIGPAVSGLVARMRQAPDATAHWLETVSLRDAARGPKHLEAKFSVVRPTEGRQSGSKVRVLALVSPVKPCDGEPAKGHKPVEAPAPPTAAPPTLADQSTVDEVRKMVVAKSGQFTAGHLELIGLDDVRDTLGDRWEKLASRVYDMADRILRSRLSRQDVFRRDADGNYVICFGELCGEQAWFKARALGQEIREALIGEEANDQFAEFKLDADTRERISGVKAETYEIEIDDEELDEIPDVTHLIKQKVGQAAANLRKRGAQLVSELAENCGVQLLLTKNLDGKNLPIRVAAFDPRSLMIVQQLQGIYSGASRLVAQLVTLLLGSTLAYIFEKDPAAISTTIVEVHFSTLADKKSAQAYFEICNSAIGVAARSLIYSVKDIPDGLHQSRFGDVIRALRNYSRCAAIQVRQPSLGSLDLTEVNTSIVTIGFDDLKLMYRRNPDATLRFVQTLRKLHIRVAVNGVSDSEGMPALDAIEPDFLSFSPTM